MRDVTELIVVALIVLLFIRPERFLHRKRTERSQWMARLWGEPDFCSPRGEERKAEETARLRRAGWAATALVMVLLALGIAWRLAQRVGVLPATL